MKKYNISFIGSGKMASAIIKGLISSQIINPKNLIATGTDEEKCREKSQKLGIKVITDNKVAVQNSDIIFIAVKPSQVENIAKEISPFINSDKLIISIAAGVTIKKLETLFPQNSSIIRVMPNTPALIGEGMSGIFGGSFASEEDVELVENLFSTIGKCIIVDNEAQMDIVTAISGSGPAFFYKIIDDIAKAGEKLGLEYEKSLVLSIQTALGSAKMSLNRDVSMKELISNVATKGGCTRVGVDTMEEEQLDKILFKVIENTTKKASELGQ